MKFGFHALIALATLSSAALGAGVTKVKDVETLNDAIGNYADKKVAVSGEVKDRIDKNSFVLESGGIFNDEIVVIVDPKAKAKLKDKMSGLKDDQKVEVTGTVRTVPVVSLRNELSWDLDPQLEAELEGVSAALVADSFTIKED